MIMIDASSNVSSHLSELKATGVTAIGRYYSKQAWKLLTAKEAQAIRGAGLSIVAVYEDGAIPEAFGSDSGTFAAQRALQQAEAVEQEAGTAIYFAVDFDADEGEVNSRIEPYFRAVRTVFDSFSASYRIGVYGSGLTCRMLLDADLCELAWLSQSTGHREHAAFKASNRWAIAQGPSSKLGALDIDSDETRGDFGAFPPLSLSLPSVVGQAAAVTAAAVEERTILAGSSRAPLAGAQIRGPSDGEARVEATVVLTRKTDIPPAELRAHVAAKPDERAVADHANFTDRFGASDDAIAAVRGFAARYGLTVVGEDAKRRVVNLSGRVQDMQRAFGTTLHDCETDEGVYRGRQGPLLLPAALAGHVEAVLGLDNRPVAKPRVRARAVQTAYFPNQLAPLYDFPVGDGGGQTVAIIELGGNCDDGDLAAYWRAAGVSGAPRVQTVSVSPGAPVPYGQDPNSDGEVMLDIEVVGSMAPGAKIVVYFAANTDQGFYEAVSQAVHDPATTSVSISWGSPEKSWTAQTMRAWATLCEGAALLNVPIFVASGDHGCADEEQGDDGFDGQRHVDFPGSCAQGVFACGGTTLRSGGGAIVNETAWNDGDGWATGGGVSTFFQAPSWQKGLSADGSTALLMRGVPDVAGDADPSSGINVIVGHQPMSVSGGTSAVAPQWAALAAILSQNLGRKVGFFLPLLYANAGHPAMSDIVVGDNGVYGVTGFSARPGWDACTGLGSPRGKQILALLGGAQSRPTASPTSSEEAATTIEPAAAAAASTPFDPNKAASFGCFVAAAYSMFDSDPENLTPKPSQEFPADFSLTAWVQMRDFIVADGPPIFYGFIAQSKAQPGQCVLAIRGTSNPEEWWDDANAAFRTAFKDPACGTVGSGFARIYDTLEVVEAAGASQAGARKPRSLKSQGGFARQVAAHVCGLSSRAAKSPAAAPTGSITVVGHSLGAALATLYTLDNAVTERLSHPAIYTFASPLVGDATFAAKFNSLGLASWRIVNRPDLVPNVPPAWLGFVHVNSKEQLDSQGVVKASFGCWHSLQTYLHLLYGSLAVSPDCAA